MRRLVFTLCCSLIASATLAAHDRWIDPTSFVPDVGKIVGVRLRVGEDLIGDPLPRDPALIDRFVVVDSLGRRDLIGRDGADPAGLLRVATPGLHVIGYESRPSAIALAAEKFTQYLKEEGLDEIVALRATRKQSQAEGREAFARCAKSLIVAGPASTAQRDQPLGLTLELVAERNPFALSAGDELPVRLTYQGKPLAGVLVTAINKRNPAAKVSSRSDAGGRVRFKLSADGMWLIKAVHMIPAPAGASSDWLSYWASLTFAVGR